MTIFGKRVFAEISKQRNLTSSRIIRVGPTANEKCLYIGREATDKQRVRQKMEAEVGVM